MVVVLTPSQANKIKKIQVHDKARSPVAAQALTAEIPATKSVTWDECSLRGLTIAYTH